MNKKVIFTVLYGDYDNLKEPHVVTPGWDYIAFIDEQTFKTKGAVPSSTQWAIHVVPTPETKTDARKKSRYHKILGPEYQYETSIYIDASYKIKRNLDDFIKDKEAGVWMTSHPQRDCVYKEGQIVREKKLDDPEVVLQQLGRYRDEGYPDRNGLFRCGCILRIGECHTFNREWWHEVDYGSWRDQISAPYAAWKSGITINPIPHGQVEQYFKLYLHKPFKLTGGVMRADTPEEIRQVPTDCWVQVGECDYAQRATQAYKRVHLICTPTAYIFPRWLFNHVWQIDQMEKIIRLYGGTVVYWNEE